MRDDSKGPGRPREFDETTALQAIMSLFWSKGYEGTSLADIMTATGLNKGSLYAAFGDKRSMYLKAFAHYDREVVHAAAAALRQPGDPGQRIYAFLSAPVDALAQSKERRGCFLCNASADQAGLDADTAKAVREGFNRLNAALVATLQDLSPKQGQDAYARRARSLLAVYIGLQLMARSGLDPKQLTETRDDALKTLLW